MNANATPAEIAKTVEERIDNDEWRMRMKEIPHVGTRLTFEELDDPFTSTEESDEVKEAFRDAYGDALHDLVPLDIPDEERTTEWAYHLSEQLNRDVWQSLPKGTQATLIDAAFDDISKYHVNEGMDIVEIFPDEDALPDSESGVSWFIRLAYACDTLEEFRKLHDRIEDADPSRRSIKIAYTISRKVDDPTVEDIATKTFSYGGRKHYSDKFRLKVMRHACLLLDLDEPDRTEMLDALEEAS